MIKYFFTHFFHKRVQILIAIILVLTTALTIGLANPFIDQAEMFLNMSYFNVDYHLKTTLIIKYILMFSISLILIDHDATFIKPLISYFGRFKVSLYKLLFYLIITSTLIIVIYAIIINAAFLTTPYYKFEINYFKDYIKIGVDMLILTLILLIIVRDNRKSLSFLTLIIIIIITFVQEDFKVLWLSYLLPLSSSMIYETANYIWYLNIYVLALIFIYFVVFLHENI